MEILMLLIAKLTFANFIPWWFLWVYILLDVIKTMFGMLVKNKMSSDSL